MNPLKNITRAALLLVSLLLLVGAPAVTAAAATGSGTAASGTGWIRLAHLSPNTPAVDVYLYSFGNPDAKMVLHHVGYGDVSPYLAVPGGDYSVAMRGAGASPTSPPVLSASIKVTAGSAYTALAVGPRSGLHVRVYRDDLSTPSGRALVRVVQASMKHAHVTVSWDGKVIASKLPFASVTSYRPVAPGAESVAVTAGAGDAKSALTLTPGSIHTLIVLDGAHGLEVDNLVDANGSSKLPAGGAQTGFGGTAPRGAGSPLPWLEVIAAGAAVAVGGSLGLRRSRRAIRPRHARPSRQARPARA
ncbi:MAG TPA: DUF4397 domain-containing protein [Trebonia sp.]|jgi:hypothetical protein|nr:DUF4397 domain-containing protein [Trebonia sp.]